MSGVDEGNPSPQTPEQPQWRHTFTAFSILLLAVGLLYGNTLASLINTWLDSGLYGHSFLIIPLSAYLVWRQRHILVSEVPRPSLWALPFISLLSLGWLVGSVLEIQALKFLCVVLAVPASVLALFGNRVLWRVKFPLALLAFTVPAWDPVSLPLQDLTTIATYNALKIIGVPVFLDGHYISIPEGRFVIEDVCGGLRYFIASLMLGSLFAYLFYDDIRRRIGFTVAAVAIGIVTNWLRVTIVIMSGHLTNMTHPFVHDHILLGWVLFGIGLVPLFWIGSRNSVQHETTLVAASPQWTPMDSKSNDNRTLLVSIALASITLLAAGPFGAYRLNATAADSAADVLRAPAAVAPWSGPRKSDDTWSPQFHGTSAELKVIYQNNGRDVYLYIGNYARQSQGAELINETNTLYNEPYWRSIREEERKTVTIADQPREVRENLLVSSTGKSRLVWHWYRVSGRDTTRNYTAKLYELRNLIVDKPGSAVIALAADYTASPDEARQVLKDFLAVHPDIKTD